MQIFGYQIKKAKPEDDSNKLQSLPEDNNLDGAIDISSNFYGFYNFGMSLDAEATEDEQKLVTKYREMALQPEVDRAITDIINDTFAYSDKHYPVKVNLNNIETIPDDVKEKIVLEFENIQDMLNFKNECHSVFRNWYVDGRLYYQKVINVDHPELGIRKLNYIDPRKIKKVKEVKKTNEGPRNGTRTIRDELNKEYYEYYLYNPAGISSKKPQGVSIAPDSIVFIHSGIFDKTKKVIYSFLHKAMKHFRNLRMLEDSVVIYRLTRAPEKRIFNIEVGRLPKLKAEQHVQEVMTKHRKKLIYDTETGEVKDAKKVMTMMEDFWFPQRDGKGTKVDTLPRGEALDKMEDVDYFRKKLYEALEVPFSRYQESTPFSQRGSEITRDELKFAKFITRLRKRFSALFEDLLGNQLMLKNILTPEEWEAIKGKVIFDYLEDSFVSEQKKLEIFQIRFTAYRDVVPLAQDKFVSRRWIRENILQMTEEEWQKIKEEIKREEVEEPWPIGGGGAMMPGMQPGMDPNNPMMGGGDDMGIQTLPPDQIPDQDPNQMSEVKKDRILKMLNEIIKL